MLAGLSTSSISGPVSNVFKKHWVQNRLITQEYSRALKLNSSLTLANDTAAETGIIQTSSGLILEGRAFKSTSPIQSQSVKIRQQAVPRQGTSVATGAFRVQSSVNNVEFVNVLTVSGTTGGIGFIGINDTPTDGGYVTVGADVGLTGASSGRPVFLRSGASNPINLDSTVGIHIGTYSTTNGGQTGPVVFRGADHTWHQRNSTNAQSFAIFNTYTSDTNHEKAVLDWRTTANVFRFGTEKGSGGGTARSLSIVTDGIERLLINAAGEIFLSGIQTSAGTSGSLYSNVGIVTISP